MIDQSLILKPKLTAQERKIIAMVIDGLPSENSRRAYQSAVGGNLTHNSGEFRVNKLNTTYWR